MKYRAARREAVTVCPEGVLRALSRRGRSTDGILA